MKLGSKIIHIVLIVLTAFLAFTGMLGGIGLLAHFNTPPLELLQGSPFNNYIIPGLALFIIVGGSALLAFILLIRKSKFAVLASTAAGIVIVFFEFVEVMIIGSPTGIARTLQIFYFGLGTLIEIASLGNWFIDLLQEK
jgi:hypothetical protein